MSDEHGPIMRVVGYQTAIQESGVILVLEKQYDPLRLEPPPVTEAVLLKVQDSTGLADELRDAVEEWFRIYRQRDE